MKLINLIPEEVKTVSVIGMTKNAGKTVTLNRLIIEAVEEKRILGLTSIGRDGEQEDVVTGTEKPGIDVVPDTLLATTDGCLTRSNARVEILENTREKTPVGQVLIVRVMQAGRVELAGPDTSRGVRYVCDRMLGYGAEQVLVDGALNRISSASPAITDACILSTGAAFDRDLHRVVEETAHQVRLLGLPLWKAEDELLNRKNDESMDAWLPEKCAVGLVTRKGEIRTLDLITALNGGREIGRSMSSEDQGVLIRGSLTGRTLKDLMNATQLYRQIPLIIEDATRLFVTSRDWQIWQKRGLQVKVLRKSRLLFITINPWSPGGWTFDSRVFRDEMKKAAKPYDVINVLGREEIH